MAAPINKIKCEDVGLAGDINGMRQRRQRHKEDGVAGDITETDTSSFVAVAIAIASELYQKIGMLDVLWCAQNHIRDRVSP